MQSVTVISEEVLDKMLKDIAAALLEADVNVRVVGQLRKAIKTRAALEEEVAGANRSKLIQRAVVDELVEYRGPGCATPRGQEGQAERHHVRGTCRALGKLRQSRNLRIITSAKASSAAWSAPTRFKAGAYDQLKQNATKLRCPFYGSYTEADPVAIAAEGVAQFRKEKYEVIIVDTSGRHRQEAALFEEMQEIRVAVEPDNVVFVLDATQGQAVHEQATSFHEAIDIGSCSGYEIGRPREGRRCPVRRRGDRSSDTVPRFSGEHFDDFEPFVARSFVSRLLGMGDMSHLVKQIKDTIGDDKNDEMMEKFSKGEFTVAARHVRAVRERHEARALIKSHGHDPRDSADGRRRGRRGQSVEAVHVHDGLDDGRRVGWSRGFESGA